MLKYFGPTLLPTFSQMTKGLSDALRLITKQDSSSKQSINMVKELHQLRYTISINLKPWEWLNRLGMMWTQQLSETVGTRLRFYPRFPPPHLPLSSHQSLSHPFFTTTSPAYKQTLWLKQRSRLKMHSKIFNQEGCLHQDNMLQSGLELLGLLTHRLWLRYSKGVITY